MQSSQKLVADKQKTGVEEDQWANQNGNLQRRV